MPSKPSSRSFQRSRLGLHRKTLYREHVLDCLSPSLTMRLIISCMSPPDCASLPATCACRLRWHDHFSDNHHILFFVPGFTFMTIRLSRHEERERLCIAGVSSCARKSRSKSRRRISGDMRKDRQRSKTRDCQAGPALFGPMDGKRLRAQEEWRTKGISRFGRDVPGRSRPRLETASSCPESEPAASVAHFVLRHSGLERGSSLSALVVLQSG